MFKLSFQYIWQWLMVMVILFTMFSGIDSFFDNGHTGTHEEELKIEQNIEDHLNTIVQRLDAIIERLDKRLK